MNTFKLDLDNGIVIDVEYSGYYLPAKVSGLPENCYPAEGECNWEITDAMFLCCETDMTFDLSPDQLKVLEIEFRDQIEEKAWNRIVNHEDDYDPY